MRSYAYPTPQSRAGPARVVTRAYARIRLVFCVFDSRSTRCAELVNRFRHGSLVMRMERAGDAGAVGDGGGGSAAGGGGGVAALAAVSGEPGGGGAAAAARTSGVRSFVHGVSGARSRLLFGCASGAVCVLATLPKPLFDVCLRLQKALTQVVLGVGGFKHSNVRAARACSGGRGRDCALVQWRSCSDERHDELSYGFIDGDLVESFVELDRCGRSRTHRRPLPCDGAPVM